MIKKKFSLALVAILQISTFAIAQQPTSTPSPASSPTAQRPATAPLQPTGDDGDVVRITTKLVQMDAVITDKNGKLVTDLRPEEVEIYENGRRQNITHFSYVVAGAAKPTATGKPAVAVEKSAGPVPPVTLRRDQVRRTIALVVDDLGLSFESIHTVREALKKFVDEQMQPGDLVAIIRTRGGIGALQQFTADKRVLYAAIEKVRWYPMGRSGVEAVPRIEATADLGLPAGKEAEVQAFLANAENLRSDAVAVGTLGALRYVIHGLRDLPGRKSVLLISDGVKVFYPNDRDSSYRVLQALEQLADLANRGSVVIYSMDVRGLQPLLLTAADSPRLTSRAVRMPVQTQAMLTARRDDFHEGQNGLNLLADQTGGLFVHNRNDLDGGIQDIMEDQRGYYLVGYRPDESTFDAKTGIRKFHSLTLKVTRRGRFNVRMRKGFYGITDAEAKPQLSTPSEQLVHALGSPFGASGVRLRLTSVFSNDAQVGSVLSSMFHISGSGLTFTDEHDGWHQAEFDIVAITYGDNGSVIDQVARTDSIRVRGDSYQNVLKEGFVYTVTVPVKRPGAYQLRVVLRDHGTEQIGSASQFVEVPDLTTNQLTLSSVLVNGVGPTALRKTGSNVKEEVNDPKSAAAVRQFHHGSIMQYGFAMYNARLDKVTGIPRLQIKVRILRDGKPVFTGQDEAFQLNNQSDLKRLAVSGGVQLGSQMAPGEYVFLVIVTDLLADQKHRVATQWIDFEIIE